MAVGAFLAVQTFKKQQPGGEAEAQVTVPGQQARAAAGGATKGF